MTQEGKSKILAWDEKPPDPKLVEQELKVAISRIPKKYSDITFLVDETGPVIKNEDGYYDCLITVSFLGEADVTDKYTLRNFELRSGLDVDCYSEETIWKLLYDAMRELMQKDIIGDYDIECESFEDEQDILKKFEEEEESNREYYGGYDR